MIVPVMGKDPRWLLVEVCREFQRGKCSRTEDECRFAHPPAHVAIQNGKVTACFDSLKGRCHRDNCKYLHPPKHIKAQMENNGRLLQQQQQQQQLAFQQQAFAPLAQQMLTNPSFISTWPLSLPGSNGTYLQQPLAFLPDASALTQTPSRRLDKSDKLEVCRESQRGACSREECRFAHPPRHVSIDSSDGMVTVCMDFMKGRCQREMCRYFHPPSHLQGRVRAAQQQSVPNFGEPFKKQTALEVPLLMPTAGAATALQSFNQPLGLQFTSLIPTMPLLAPGLPLVQTQVPQNTSSNGLPVCRDYVSGQCHREACRYAHVKDKNVEVIDGKVTVCRDAVKGKCTRPNCKYYHPTTSSSSSASAPDQTPR